MYLYDLRFSDVLNIRDVFSKSEQGCKDGWRVVVAGYLMVGGLLGVAVSVWVNSWAVLIFFVYIFLILTLSSCVWFQL